MTYTTSVARLLGRVGAERIADITVVRAPVAAALEGVLSAVSAGTYNAGKQDANLDKMFHLGVILRTDKGRYRLEKVEVVSLTPYVDMKGSEYAPGFKPAGGAAMTVATLMFNTKKAMGDSNYFGYDAFQNNCQDFILAVCRAAGATSPAVTNFIKQDVTAIVKRMPAYVSAFAKGLTTLGAIVAKKPWQINPDRSQIGVGRDPSLPPPKRDRAYVESQFGMGSGDPVADKLASIHSLFGNKRRRGGGDGGDLAKREATPLSDADIAKLLPGVKISTYPQLASMQSIDEMLDDKGQGVLLELTTSGTDGHWTSVQRTPDGYEFFSSMGKRVDWELENWLSPETRERLHEPNDDLTRLLQKARAEGHRIVYNAVELQARGGSVATCGRWCVVRLLLGDLSLPQFRALIGRQEHGETGDAFVTMITDRLLHGDRSALTELRGGGDPCHL